MLPPGANAPRFTLPTFEGPLDLLLHLIRENQVDIYDIPIAEIARQYLEYLALWESMDLAVAGEYLVMAATLLQIKSQMLLPQPPPPPGAEEEEDPRAELVERLLEYQRYQGTVEAMRVWEDERRRLFFRGALENPDDYLLPLPEGAADARALVAALRRVLEAAGVGDEAVTAVVPQRRVGLRVKMAELMRKVRGHADGVGFDALFEPPLVLYDIVLTFLALLELLRQGRVRAEQRRGRTGIKLYPQEEAAA